MKPEEKELFRFYARLRNSLFPISILQLCRVARPYSHRAAMPLVFRMIAVDNIINQYMFGEHLLVAIYSDSHICRKGTDQLLTAKRLPATGSSRLTYRNEGRSALIREGAIIPYQKPSQFIGEHPLDTIELRIYPTKQAAIPFGKMME